MRYPGHQFGIQVGQLTTRAQLAEQLGQERRQSLTTHIVGDLPARTQQRHLLRPVHGRTSVAWWQRSARERPTQQLDGVLPVIPSRSAALVQDPALLLAAGQLIPHGHRRRVVVPGLSLHLTGPPFGQIFSEPVGQICSEATTPLWVSSVSTQVAPILVEPRVTLLVMHLPLAG